LQHKKNYWGISGGIVELGCCMGGGAASGFRGCIRVLTAINLTSSLPPSPIPFLIKELFSISYIEKFVSL
jgi:hypothetical protein